MEGKHQRQRAFSTAVPASEALFLQLQCGTCIKMHKNYGNTVLFGWILKKWFYNAHFTILLTLTCRVSTCCLHHAIFMGERTQDYWRHKRMGTWVCADNKADLFTGQQGHVANVLIFVCSMVEHIEGFMGIHLLVRCVLQCKKWNRSTVPVLVKQEIRWLKQKVYDIMEFILLFHYWAVIGVIFNRRAGGKFYFYL